MGNILAMSGKKQSGKNTTANWLLGITMLELKIVRKTIEIQSNGKLRISDIFGNEDMEGIFDYYSPNPAMKEFLEENIHPWIKFYSFADLLKQNICVDILGLKHEHVFGTDAQKKELTHLRWEDMPGVITRKPIDFAWSLSDGYTEEKNEVFTIAGRLGPYYEKVKELTYHEPGLMTGREVMQYVGSEVFRKMYEPVWAVSTLKKIKQDNSALAVITDCRFPNEVFETQKAGGKVVRLLRELDENDRHESEIALDPDRFDQKNFDAIIDNRHMSIAQLLEATGPYLEEWGFISLKKNEE